MNIYHLRYFVTLAHMEHYTKAAEVLSLTQPSLSYAINTLEEELGVKLFEKSGRNVTLTKYGKKLLADAEEILARLDASVEELILAGQGNDTIEIAFLRVLGSNFVPRLMRRFLNANPDKKVRFQMTGNIPVSADIIDGLKNRKYEIAFCSKIKDETSVEFIPVCREELVVIVPKKHPLAEKDSVTLQELTNEKFISYAPKSGLDTIIRKLFMENVGMIPEISCTISEDQVAAGLVANGFGIAIVPHMPLLHSLPIKILNLKDTDYERNFYMCYLKDCYISPVSQAFIEYVKELTKDRPFIYSERMKSPI